MSASDSLASFTDSLLNAAPPAAFSAATSFLKSEAAFFDNISAWLTSRVEAEQGFMSRLSLGPLPKPKHGKNDSQVILPPSLVAFRAAFFEREGGEIQAAHERFRVRVENEVIPSIRSEEDWARVRTLQTSVERVVRDYEDCQTKLVKAQKKLDFAAQGSKASSTAKSKVATLENELAGVMHNYTSVAPGLYGLAESIHKKRLVQLKEAFALFQTIQSDLARERMEIAEKGLVDCLALDPQVEAQEWLSMFRDEFGVRRTSYAGSTHLGTSPERGDDQTMHSNSPTPRGLHLPQRDRSSSVNSSPFTPHQENLDATFNQPSTSPRGPLTEELRDDAASGRSIKSVHRKSLVPSLLRRKSKTHTKAMAWASPSLNPEPEELSRHNSLDAAQPSSNNGNPQEASQENLVDSQGFTIPPVGREKAHWETSDLGNTPELVSESTIPLPKVSQIAITPSEVAEDNDQRDVALERMKSTLLSAKSQPAIGRRQTTRGRRDVKSLAFASGDGPTLKSSYTSSALTTPVKNDRTFSMVSGSTPSVLSFEHHEPPPVGFHAWCTERCRAKVDSLGNLHVVVLGSIAFSARGINNMATTTSIALKGASLARIVPNPALLTSEAEDSWLLNMTALEKSCDSNMTPSLAFKYQLDLDSTQVENMLAITCQTAWKIEANLTSLIISLQRQETRSFSGEGPQDVSVTAPISSNVTSHQAKPDAAWKSEGQALTWDVGTLSQARSGLQLLARVICEGSPVPQTVSVRWREPKATLSDLVLKTNESQPQLDSFERQVIGELDVAPQTVSS